MSEVRARVWATPMPGGRCWHYEVAQTVVEVVPVSANHDIHRTVRRVIDRGDSARFDVVLAAAVLRVTLVRRLLKRHPDAAMLIQKEVANE